MKKYEIHILSNFNILNFFLIIFSIKNILNIVKLSNTVATHC